MHVNRLGAAVFGMENNRLRLERDVRGKAAPEDPVETSLHPAWVALIRYCRELRHGEIERLSIQDGLPVIAEQVRQKVKFKS
jgi:hypothetical protein